MKFVFVNTVYEKMGQKDSKPLPVEPDLKPLPPPPIVPVIREIYIEYVVQDIIDNSSRGSIIYKVEEETGDIILYLTNSNYFKIYKMIEVGKPYLFIYRGHHGIDDVTGAETHIVTGQIKGFLDLKDWGGPEQRNKYMELILTTSPIRNRRDHFCRLLIEKERTEALKPDVEYRISYKLFRGLNKYLVGEITVNK